MTLFFIVEVLDMGDVLLFFLNAIDICCKGIIVATLFLPTMASKTFLVVLVLSASLALIGGRLLGVLPTKYVSRRIVSKVILLGVLFLFFRRLIASETLGINLADI